jgi:hypothetical protein
MPDWPYSVSQCGHWLKLVGTRDRISRRIILPPQSCIIRFSPKIAGSRTHPERVVPVIILVSGGMVKLASKAEESNVQSSVEISQVGQVALAQHAAPPGFEAGHSIGEKPQTVVGRQDGDPYQQVAKDHEHE